MQNPIQKFRQSSIVFEKPGILSENFRYLLLKLRTCFLLTKQNKKNPEHLFVDIVK